MQNKINIVEIKKSIIVIEIKKSIIVIEIKKIKNLLFNKPELPKEPTTTTSMQQPMPNDDKVLFLSNQILNAEPDSRELDKTNSSSTS